MTRIMSWWCWFLYIVVAWLPAHILSINLIYHWQVMTGWSAAIHFAAVLGGVLVLGLLVWRLKHDATEGAKKTVPGRGKLAIAAIAGLFAVTGISLEIGLNLVASRLDQFLRSVGPNVDDFYHNGDKTRLAGRVIRMMILKNREEIPKDQVSVRATLKDIADHLPSAWENLAATPKTASATSSADRALINGVHEEGLVAFVFDRDRNALDDRRWTVLITRWTTETNSQPLPEEVRAKLVSQLRSTFATSLREGLKLAYVQNDKAWPALQIDMAAHLMEEARRGLSTDKDEWKHELAALHDDASAIQSMIMNLDREAARTHSVVIERFASIDKDLTLIKGQIAEVLKRLIDVQDKMGPEITREGVVAPPIKADLAASIREMIANGNPLEKAAAEVALAAVRVNSDRWLAADSAITLCKVWKSSRVDWTEIEEYRFLLVRGDRVLFNDDPDAAVTTFEEAIKIQPTGKDGLLRLAIALSEQRKSNHAEAWARAQKIFERYLPPESQRTIDDASAITCLALVYTFQGQFANAEPLYKESLQLRENAFGQEHLDVAQSLNNLAAHYFDLTKYSLAEPLYTRSRAIREKALGAKHPLVAESLNNDGMLCLAMGRYDEAEKLFQGSLAIYESEYGTKHPLVAASLNNMAILYDTQGQYANAAEQHERSLLILKDVHGLEHYLVATSMNNLAEVYRKQGRYADAEPLYKQSLEIRKRVLGPHHADVGQSLNNLGLLYATQKEYVKAEPLYTESLAIRKQALGHDHLDVSQTLNNLGLLHSKLDQYDLAEPLYLRALEIREAKLGPDHFEVGVTLNNLASLYNAQSKIVDAERLFRRALKIFETALDPNHPYVAAVCNHLEKTLRKAGRIDEAIQFEERAKKIRAIER